MVATGYTFSGKRIMIDVIAFAKTLTNPSDPNALITETLQILYRVPLTASSREQIKRDILLVGQTSDYYWTEAWTAHINNPSDTAAATLVRNRLRDLFKYFMNLAEYQLA
jgi:hypothetical protein